MNPYKIKTIEEFTIDDCETYIRRYPYGEHITEVRKRLKQLRLEQRGGRTDESRQNSDGGNRPKHDVSEQSSDSSVSSSAETSQKDISVGTPPNNTPLPQSSYSESDGLWWRVLLTVLIIGGLIALIIGTVGIGTPVAIVAGAWLHNIWKDYDF